MEGRTNESLRAIAECLEIHTLFVGWMEFVNGNGDMTHWSDNRILLTRGGSHACGLARSDSDEDLRGVALPPVSWLLGFEPPFQRAQTYKVRDTQDLVVHTLSKFCRLALNANPNMLEMLFCDDDQVLMQTQMGYDLRMMRHQFLSARVYVGYSAYAARQLKLMRNHNTAQGSHRVWVEQFGYDTKNAMHLIRSLLTARTLLNDGRMEVRRPDRDFLLSIHDGQYTMMQIQQMAEDLDHECQALQGHSPLPQAPDMASVEKWMIDQHKAWVNGDDRLLMPL